MQFLRRFRPDDNADRITQIVPPPEVIIQGGSGGGEVTPPVVVVPRAFPDDEIVQRFKAVLGVEPTESQYWALRGVSATENIDPHILAYKYAADTARAERDFIQRKFQDMVGSPPTDAEYWTLVGLNQQGENLDAHIMGMKSRRPPLQPVAVLDPPPQPIHVGSRGMPRLPAVRVPAGRLGAARTIRGVSARPGRTLKALQILIRGR